MSWREDLDLISNKVYGLNEKEVHMLYEQTHDELVKMACLKKLLHLANKRFETVIAKSDSAPYEVAWEDIGDEMWNLLQMSEHVLGFIVTSNLSNLKDLMNV